MIGLNGCGRFVFPLACAACIALLPLAPLRAQTGSDAEPPATMPEAMPEASPAAPAAAGADGAAQPTVPMALTPEAPPSSQSGGAAPSPPIDIESTGGIEWDRTRQVIIARENARAVRGDLTVTADVLTAFYRQKPDGSAEVYRLDAAGHVKITTPSQTATSDAASYDMVSTQLTLTRDAAGERLKVVTGDGVVTADERIDYNRTTRVMVARGNAIAEQPQQTLKGDVITAQMRETSGGKPAPKGRGQFQRVDADGNVDALSPDERIIADHGTYFGDSDTAEFQGSVKIFRGESVLDGCRAEFDLASGFSKLLPCANATGSKARVRGVIVPTPKNS